MKIITGLIIWIFFGIVQTAAAAESGTYILFWLKKIVKSSGEQMRQESYHYSC